MTLRHKQFSLYILLVAVLIVVDQLSKQWAEMALMNQPPIGILPFLQFVLAYNTGAAFSFLGNAGGWQQYLFIGIAVVVSFILVIWLWRCLPNNHRLSIAISFVLSGAIGNLIDRVLFGKVIDFISVFYQQWYFPVFNVADICINIGAFLLIWDAFFPAKPDASSVVDN